MVRSGIVGYKDRRGYLYPRSGRRYLGYVSIWSHLFSRSDLWTPRYVDSSRIDVIVIPPGFEVWILTPRSRVLDTTRETWVRGLSGVEEWVHGSDGSLNPSSG